MKILAFSKIPKILSATPETEKMPMDSSCGGFKLRCLALGIGYFEVVASAIGIVISSFLLFYLDRLDSKELYRNVAIITMTICVLALSVGFFLINGIHKNDRTQLKPWIVIKGIFVCFYLGVLCLTIWLGLLKPNHPWIEFGVAWIEVAIIGKYFVCLCILKVENFICVSVLSYLSLSIVKMYYKIMPRYDVGHMEIVLQDNSV